MDIISYVLGLKKNGTGTVVIEEGGDYTFTDENEDGNVVMESEDN